jgi:ribosomal protein S18 acetylase RimI-like enzyme
VPSPPAPGRPAAADFTIRDLRWADFDALVGTYYELYEERDRGDPIGIHLHLQPPSREDEVAWFAGYYRQVLAGETITQVADVGGQAVGNCTVAPDGGHRSGEMGHVGVLGILVNRRYRGLGIGRALMRATLDRCRGVFELVRLSVFADNDGAKRLYRSLGFVPCGTYARGIKRRGRYIDHELMMLDLLGSASERAANR